MSAALEPLDDPSPASENRPRRTWISKFRDAGRGWLLGIRGHSSFSVHFFFAALVIVCAAAFGCSVVEWCLLLASIGGVLSAELFNSAFETLFRGLPTEVRDRAFPALDIAAGAVLLATVFACGIGCLIFVPRLWMLIP